MADQPEASSSRSVARQPTPAGSDQEEEVDPLDLTSLDADSLFDALTAVEKVSSAELHLSRSDSE